MIMRTEKGNEIEKVSKRREIMRMQEEPNKTKFNYRKRNIKSSK